MTVAERIRERRRSAGLTQDQLARRLGVSTSAVQAWERGLRFPGQRSQRALAAMFGRSPFYFKERNG